VRQGKRKEGRATGRRDSVPGRKQGRDWKGSGGKHYRSNIVESNMDKGVLQVFLAPFWTIIPKTVYENPL